MVFKVHLLLAQLLFEQRVEHHRRSAGIFESADCHPRRGIKATLRRPAVWAASKPRYVVVRSIIAVLFLRSLRAYTGARSATLSRKTRQGAGHPTISMLLDLLSLLCARWLRLTLSQQARLLSCGWPGTRTCGSGFRRLSALRLQQAVGFFRLALGQHLEASLL